MSIPFQNALFFMSHSQCHFQNLCQFGVFVLHKSINWIVSFSGHLEQDFMFILVNFLFPSFPHFMRVNTFVFIVPGHLKICRILQCLKTLPHWTPLLFHWVSDFVLQKNKFHVQENLIHFASRSVIPECIIWGELGTVLPALGHLTSLSHQQHILIHYRAGPGFVPSGAWECSLCAHCARGPNCWQRWHLR